MLTLDDLALGTAPPDDINVVITASTGTEPVAITVAGGFMMVTRLFHTAMRLPGNLGVIPRTLGENAAPLPALVVGDHVLAPGTVLPSRPVGVIYVAGEGAEDVTILAVPAKRLTSRYDGIATYTDLPSGALRQLANYFQHYRDVEEHARPRSSGWGDVSEARRVVTEAAARARQPVA